jgi:hypothetical protein
MEMATKIKEVKSLDHFGCWSDGFITLDGWILLLSLFGSSTRVNAIKAVILKGEPVYLQELWTGENRIQAQRPSHKVQSWTRQLARGTTHCLLFTPDYLSPEGKFHQKLFYGDSQEQLMEKFFYAAQQRYSTPLMPDWTEWVLGQMLQTQEINALGFNQVMGVQFLEEAELEERLFEAGSPLNAGDIGVAANG